MRNAIRCNSFEPPLISCFRVVAKLSAFCQFSMSMLMLSFSKYFFSSLTLISLPSSYIKSCSTAILLILLEYFHLRMDGSCDALSCACSCLNLMVNEKVEPLPFSPSAQTLPCIMLTSSFVMESPSPVPPYFLVIDASACVKLLKSLSLSSGESPIPVSTTIKNSSTTSSIFVFNVISMPTYPCSVNLTALDTRLFSICVRRSSSPISLSGISGATFNVKRRPLRIVSIVNIFSIFDIKS